MVGWHHRLDRHEFEQTLGVGDGQGSLACCSPWGHKESDTTEELNWTTARERFYFISTGILVNIEWFFFSLEGYSLTQFSSVQSLSRVQLFETPWTAAHQASLSITNSQSLLKLMSIPSVLPSNHLILCHPLLLLSSIFPSIRVFSNESVLRIRWPAYWSFSFSISPSNEYSGLISFRTDWLDFLAVKGTLKSLLQHHSSKASILRCSAFFIVQLSHPCMITGKTTALTRWTLVSKVMSLLFNMVFNILFFQGAR